MSRRFINTLQREPEHKQQVIVKTNYGSHFPAIFYCNGSYYGFYPYTTFYDSIGSDPQNLYRKVNYTRIEGVIAWIPIY